MIHDIMPGTLDEKLRVYEQPYREIVNNLLSRGDAYDILKSKNVIEFMSTSFIRGLTIDNAVVIVDEIQNLSFAELDSVITRVGEGTKIVFCGDFRQTDLKNAKEKSGIHDFMSILDKMKKFDHIEFLETDIVRSGLVRDYIVTKTEMGLAQEYMKKILLAAMLVVSSQSVAADWEMVPSSEFCIARNGIDWGNGNIGETRFGWVDDKLYLSAINDKWNVNASEENPFQSVGEADFDGVRVPVMVYSQESTTVIVELDGSVENLDIIVNSKSMKIYPVGDYKNFVFGFELDDMKQAIARVGQCYFTTKA